MALEESKHVNNSFIYEPSSQSFLHSKTKTCTLAEEESDLVREPEIVTDGLPTPHWMKTSAVLTHMLIIKDALNFTFNEKVNTGSAEYASTKYLQYQPG